MFDITECILIGIIALSMILFAMLSSRINCGRISCYVGYGCCIVALTSILLLYVKISSYKPPEPKICCLISMVSVD